MRWRSAPTRRVTPACSTRSTPTTWASRSPCRARWRSMNATAACSGSTSSTTAAATSSRRARELVVFSLVTVGNYDYGFNWIFGQDGTLEVQAVLTGIMLTKGVKETIAAVARLVDRRLAQAIIDQWRPRRRQPFLAPRRAQRRGRPPSALLQLPARSRRRRRAQQRPRDQYARWRHGRRIRRSTRS